MPDTRQRQRSEPTRVEITCTRCKKQATVPFHPTPGRPVYCRECYSRPTRLRAPSPRARKDRTPERRMLDMGRKGHFVYDSMHALQNEGDIDDEEQKRTFVEMVFARGSRQGTRAALEFIDEKQRDDLISPSEAVALSKVVDEYTVKR